MSAADGGATRGGPRSWSPSASAPASMARRSRKQLVTKVDSAALQDGFDLYLHGFILADDGKWVVVQQGMRATRTARRYHWLSEDLKSFVEAPHQVGPTILPISPIAVPLRRARAEIVCRDLGVLGQIRFLRQNCCRQRHRPRPRSCRISSCASRRAAEGCHIAAPPWCARRTAWISPSRRRCGVWAPAHSLAMAAEIIHGAVRRSRALSLAHGGKDRHPYPVPLKVYDQTIAVLKSAVEKARLEQRRAARGDPPAGRPQRCGWSGRRRARRCRPSSARNEGARTTMAGAASSAGARPTGAVGTLTSFESIAPARGR